MIYATTAYKATVDYNAAHILYAALPGTATASTVAAGYSAAFAAYPGTFNGWTPTADPSTWLLTFGTAQDVNCVGIAAHTLSGATVVVESWNGATYDEEISIEPTDNSAIMAAFETVTTSRIRLSVSGAVPYVGVVYVGKALVMPVRRYAPGADVDISRQTVFKENVSQTGQIFPSRIKRVALGADYQFEHVTEDIYRSDIEPFSKAVRGVPFFIAERPGSNPRAAGYGMASGDIGYQRMGIGKRLVSVSFRFTGFADADQ